MPNDDSTAELESLKDDLSAAAVNLLALRDRCAGLGVGPSAGGDPLYFAAAQLDDIAEAAEGAIQEARRRAADDLFLRSGPSAAAEAPYSIGIRASKQNRGGFPV